MGVAAKRAIVALYLLFVTASCTRFSRLSGGNCRTIDKYDCVRRNAVECGGEQCLAPSVCLVKRRDCSAAGASNGCAPVCGQVGTPCGDPVAGLLCKFDEACVDTNGCNPLGLDPNCTPSHTCQKKDDWDIDPAFVDLKCSSFHTISSADTCGSLLEKWGMHSPRFFRLNQGFDCTKLTPGVQVCSAGHVVYKEPQCGGPDSHCEAGFECVANDDCEFDEGNLMKAECTEDIYEVCEPPTEGEKELCGDLVCDDGYVCEKTSALACGHHQKGSLRKIRPRSKNLGRSSRHFTFSPTKRVGKYMHYRG